MGRATWTVKAGRVLVCASLALCLLGCNDDDDDNDVNGLGSGKLSAVAEIADPGRTVFPVEVPLLLEITGEKDSRIPNASALIDPTREMEFLTFWVRTGKYHCVEGQVADRILYKWAPEVPVPYNPDTYDPNNPEETYNPIRWCYESSLVGQTFSVCTDKQFSVNDGGKPVQLVLNVPFAGAVSCPPPPVPPPRELWFEFEFPKTVAVEGEFLLDLDAMSIQKRGNGR
ncbi:MAG: hypothetical protein KBD01_08165 [Acidobacteria bacterium]|nr:hypothetical protein [Acidobacteriota bacterium]